ncbi:hypothetical protein PENSPDRAFT_657626 [Peniophora sp. CONT]|nr:hypothetical protein PENSPDRAFT_657626 [Peniophora sp. CONT]
MSSSANLSSTEDVFRHPDAGLTSPDSVCSLPDEDPRPSFSRLPRLARSPAVREKQTTRFSPYVRTRKPRASLAVRIDLPRMLDAGDTGLPTPVSAALSQLEEYDGESEAEVSMICSDDLEDDKEVQSEIVCSDDTSEERSGHGEAGPDDSISSYYFSSEAGALADSASVASTTSDPLALATPTLSSLLTSSEDGLSASTDSISSDPMLLVTPAEATLTTDPTTSTQMDSLPSTGSLCRLPSTMHLTARSASVRSLSDTLQPYSSWSDSTENDNLPLLYNAVLRGLRPEDLRVIAADAASEEAAEECISRVAGELFAYAARVAKGEATEDEEKGDDEMQGREGGGWWFADAWRAWRASPGESA